mmetsp:Transcript_40952/g.107550  ORF Transcript_40952/g.107550 Transcript_40952/m.107550 type:complete len:445 (+) Transcript_40952:684-2018(+)
MPPHPRARTRRGPTAAAAAIQRIQPDLGSAPGRYATQSPARRGCRQPALAGNTDQPGARHGSRRVGPTSRHRLAGELGNRSTGAQGKHRIPGHGACVAAGPRPDLAPAGPAHLGRRRRGAPALRPRPRRRPRRARQRRPLQEPGLRHLVPLVLQSGLRKNRGPRVLRRPVAARPVHHARLPYGPPAPARRGPQHLRGLRPQRRLRAHLPARVRPHRGPAVPARHLDRGGVHPGHLLQRPPRHPRGRPPRALRRPPRRGDLPRPVQARVHPARDPALPARGALEGPRVRGGRLREHPRRPPHRGPQRLPGHGSRQRLLGELRTGVRQDSGRGVPAGPVHPGAVPAPAGLHLSAGDRPRGSGPVLLRGGDGGGLPGFHLHAWVPAHGPPAVPGRSLHPPTLRPPALPAPPAGRALRGPLPVRGHPQRWGVQAALRAGVRPHHAPGM